MKVKGSITTLKSRIDASGNTIQTVTIEAPQGDFPSLHALMRQPLEITFEVVQE